VTNSFYPRSYYPGRLHLEERIPEAVVQQLAALGHEIVRVGACGIRVIVTQRDADTGVLAAGADPRRTSYALAGKQAR
jgi:gamma-glutamyltranspeptidase/glutathione hydrolase